MPRSRFIVGIDLGTTNCVVAYVDTKGRERPGADIKLFPVPQVISAGEVSTRSMLPSFLYLPGTHELPPGAGALPWDQDAGRIVGEFARSQGAKVPGRLVASAKSWLCHGGVDREAPILPWGASGDVPCVSPVEASTAFLAHIRDSWDWTFARNEEASRLATQEIVLTVPASFDEAARELTVAAARAVGFEHLTLLEEPQAAFYAWIVSQKDRWQRELRAGERILVCDIGGGTTDFSVITVVETPTGPGFRRVAVGDHLLLGGDNIDLALAHRVEQKLGEVRLDSEQWHALRYSCRMAKEKLLADDAPWDRFAVSIPGRGSKRIGGSLQSELTLEEVHSSVLDGFFPRTTLDQAIAIGHAKSGMQEFGLPFVSDPAIPRHLAAFLRSHARVDSESSGSSDEVAILRPDAILFNGGALSPAILRERLVDVVAGWFAGGSDAPYRPRVLANTDLDLAVAFGAAYYGIVRRGGGIRIGGGTARAFYVGIDPESHEQPWLCVVPRDAQEGDRIAIDRHDFELVMGRPVVFPLASSSTRAGDLPGDLVPDDADSLLRLPPLSGLMRASRKARSESVEVQLESHVTEVGTIELWCHSRTDERRWRLQIQFRAPGRTGLPALHAPAGTDDGVVIEQALVDAGVGAIRTSFQAPAATPTNDPGSPSRIVKRLESEVQLPREEWPPSLLRALWEPLLECAESRLTSPAHESRWLNLAGYCLRPGTGFPLDEHRIKALWPVFHAGVKHQKDVQCWVEWWVLWRRVAAGLARSHHEEIWRRVGPYLIPAKGGAQAAGKRAARPKPDSHELEQMWRCAASLERLDPTIKVDLGDHLAREGSTRGRASHRYWCLGRLGARVLLYGPANACVPVERASVWLRVILDRATADTRAASDAIFAISQMARVAGDRARDLDPELRSEAIRTLEALGASEAVIEPVRAYQDLAVAAESEALGDSLPVGLRLRSERPSLEVQNQPT